MVRRNVFDERRDGWFGAAANRLHAMTRERIIRNELLFEEGDIYDAELVEETERNLRALGIIGDVAITADTVRNRRINLTVYTRDRWTLGLNPTYKQEGGITNIAINLDDANLFGNAQSFSLGYNYRSDRRRPHGAEMIFVEPRLFSSRFGTRIQYKNSEDATLATLSLERTFFSTEATWAGGVYADYGKLRVRQYDSGRLIFDDYLLQKNQNAWFARSFGSRTRKYSLGAGYLRTRRETGNVPGSFYDRMDLVVLSASASQRVYYKGRFIENFGRVEDVPLGYAVTLAGGPNFHAASVDAADSYARLDAVYALGIEQRYYGAFGVAFSTFVHDRTPRESTLEYSLLQHWRATPRSTLVGRVLYARGYNWSERRQLTLGSPTGLRGYGAFAFTGQDLFLLNLEYRMFPPLSLWIFRFGGGLFLDSGTAWQAGESMGSQRFHTSAGISITVENEAQQGSGLFRIDFPFNFDRGRFAEVIIAGDRLFKAFADLGFIPPSAVR